MAENNLGNLIMLSKWDGKGNVNPAEQHCFCLEHYESRKDNFKDYQITGVNSSVPKLWCEICSPPDLGI